MAKQGQLDGACDIYIIVNACCHITDTSEEVARKVLHKLFSGTEYRLSETVVRSLIDPEAGTHRAQLKEALAKVTKIVNKYRRSFKLSPKHEFQFRYVRLYNQRSNVRGVFSRIYRIFEDHKHDSCAMMIGAGSHWTVIKRAYKDKWLILDSGALK